MNIKSNGIKSQHPIQPFFLSVKGDIILKKWQTKNPPLSTRIRILDLKSSFSALKVSCTFRKQRYLKLSATKRQPLINFVFPIIPNVERMLRIFHPCIRRGIINAQFPSYLVLLSLSRLLNTCSHLFTGVHNIS